MTAINSVAASAHPAYAPPTFNAKTKRPPRRLWTAAETRRLTALYPTTASGALCKALGRDKSTVMRHAKRLALQKSATFLTSKPGARVPWSPGDVAQLVALYPDHTARVVGQLLNRKMGAVHAKAKSLGLAKSPEFLASDKAGRIMRGKKNPGMTATQWQPGHAPWNKGQHYDPGGRSAETRFKRGNLPQTTLPVGQYRFDSTGMLQQKTSETPGPNHKRWTPVSRMVWVAANGPVPHKHIVVFKPGRSTNVLEKITIDALDCITRAEHARRNHPNTKSPELGRLYQLKGVITRQVNRINKAAKEARKQSAP